MKKFFTLIVMAIMAISASAKEDIDFSAVGKAGETITFGSWDWKDLNTPAQGEPDATTGDDSGVTYFDASAYDYICIKYKSSFKGAFIIQTKCKGTVGQWGPEFNQVSGELAANTAGVLGVKLDDMKNTIFKIAVQPQGDGGDFVIEELYWASEAEYNSAVAADPIVKWVPATKELDLNNATGGWGTKEYDPASHKATVTDGASGWWITGDYSDYDYFIIEVEDYVKGSWSQLAIFNKNVPITLEGSFVQVVDISQMDRDTNDKTVFEWGGSNCVIQGAGTSWTWKRAYFATADYVNENGIKTEAIFGDTQDILPSFGTSGWNAEYDADTKTITITGSDESDEGGKGWWYGDDGVDYSHFDNAVIELDPAATVGGFFKIDYADGSTEEVEFYPGATCIVAALNAEKKSAIKQIYVQAAKDATFTLSAAFVAVASATPEAALGTAPTVTWTVAGTTPLVEKTWDPSDTSADMTSEDGVTYTYVKEDVVLEVKTNYEFKVVKNHAWGEEYPSSNYVLTVNETAKYKVTITFNADTKDVSATAEKTGEAGPVEHTWSVKGNFNGDDNWENEYDMTKGDDGKFTVTIENVNAGNWEFKVRADKDWSISFPGSNYQLTVNVNNSTVTITFDPSDNSIEVTVVGPGDVNNDGEVGVGDLISVSNYMAEGEDSGVTKEQADVNKDGDVGVGDLISISNIMAGKEEE